jgi:tetratricopeptide (TPR) repeat protein
MATPSAPRPAVALPLEVIDGARYTDRKELGRGGMGRIVTAFDRRLRRRVAIKEMRGHDGELAARFEREILLSAKLEHPAIVTIHDGGVWPSGDPFYVMRLVPGRSLDDAIGKAKDLPARLALVPHVIAVADALAYAHGQNVIHRDLKPQNVMIGEFGETVVIDWGLAKELAAGRPSRVALATPVPSVETRLGDVLGTPAYMPPEQALGAATDESADVYAIGAILYHVLAGRPPYEGDTTAVLDAVKQTPPRPLDAIAPDAPPDLLAIVRRAMARDPGDRYPSARELADDLRAFQAGRLVGAHRYSLGELLRRWMRRHRTTIIVGLAAAIVLVVTAIVGLVRIVQEERRADDARHIAEQQRTLAVDNRKRAEELMQYMLYDMPAKLRAIGQLELLDDVAKKAASYFAALPEDGLSEAQRAERVKVHINLGDILATRDDNAGALAEYKSALASADENAAHSTQPAWQDLQISSHAALATVLARQGDTAGAVTERKSALAIAESAAAKRPSPDTQEDAADAHKALAGALRAQGDNSAALGELKIALAAYEALAKTAPSETHTYSLATIHRELGDLARLRGETLTALTELKASLATLEQLSAQHPGDVEYQHELAVTHDRIGDLLSDRPDIPGALAEYRLVEATLAKMVANDPTNARLRRNLAISRSKVGDVLRQQNDMSGALAELQASLATREELAAHDPTNMQALHDLVTVHESLGLVREAQRDRAGELAEFRTMLEIAEKAAAADHANASYQHDLEAAHFRVGDQLRTSDTKSAGEHFRAALAIAKDLAAKDPDRTDWQGELWEAHRRIGDLDVQLAAWPDALDAFRPALDVITALAAREPDQVAWQVDLAQTHDAIGRVYAHQTDATQAASHLHIAIDLATKILATAPDNAEARAELARAKASLQTCCKAR